MTISTQDETYNGWANYETWNVALWIGNDEGLYSMARDYRHALEPYKSFVEAMRELHAEMGGTSTIGIETPDGIAWNDSGIDTEALNEMIAEL